MRIVITGNMGYVGPVLQPHLKRALPGCTLIGFDYGYFAHCLTTRDGLPEARIDAQHFGDLRAIRGEVLQGADAVVHLAGISNDPMANQFEDVTQAINLDASLALARKAKTARVKRFVFASSCSVYGAASDSARSERAPVNPLTAYAKSKIGTEDALRELAGPDFQVTCLRFATACGWSGRARLDLVLNDFVASAVTLGRIVVLSDGTPWRPLIHVADMSRAIEWGLGREGDPFLAVNTGSDGWNYRIRDLARAVAAEIPGATVEINPEGQPDMRSYQVDFGLFRARAPGHQPQVDLQGAIRDLKQGLESVGFNDADFRKSHLVRLNVLREFKARGVLDDQLRWSRR